MQLNRHTLRLLLPAVLAACFAAAAHAQNSAGISSQFTLGMTPAGVSSLKHTGDVFDTDYVTRGRALGGLVISYRQPGAATWTSIRTDAAAPDFKRRGDENVWQSVTRSGDVEITSTFTLEPDGNASGLLWSFSLRNVGGSPIEVGDLAITTPFNTQFSRTNSTVDAGSFAAHQVVLTQRQAAHFWVAGHASFLYFMRPNGVGPYLVITPTGLTKLEYFDNDNGNAERGQPAGPTTRRSATTRSTTASGPAEPRGVGRLMFIHSAATGEQLARETTAWEKLHDAPEHAPAWRQAHTSVTLAPAGSAGDHADYGFKFRFTPPPAKPDATHYDSVRQVLYEENGYDIHIAPGMTVPTDLTTTIAIRTKNKIDAIVPEFAGATKVEAVSSPAGAPADQQLFKVHFSKLGENILTIRSGEKSTVLEFFVTEPLETLVKKRAAFLVSSRSRWTDTGKWYEGLISEWDALHEKKRSPEDLDGLRKYIVSCDDPGLGKAPYVASKNAIFPDQTEVAALDYYINHFVWGGLQMTEKERHPYAIYGIETWFENRNSNDAGRNGRDHIWRIYDYPHIVLLYYRMHQIAAAFPQIKTELSADDYLTRAYRTAMAFFTVPTIVEGWSAYDTGTYNELIIADVIDALVTAGRTQEADQLRAHWEQKVKTFVFAEDPYLYGSEYAFDSTTFESSAALAKWAVERMNRPDYKAPPALPAISRRGGPPRTPESFPAMNTKAAGEFMQRQFDQNVSDRGWIETAYYYMGSDYRGGFGSGYLLSYMSQMGGWGVMDYALNQAKDPVPYVRLGYASQLSSWALMNSGTKESNYGYWFPGEANDGTAAGGFEPRAFSRAWIGKTTPRGAWYYPCEIDLGFSGALRAAATIVVDDPLMGPTAYGGELTKTTGGFSVLPRDGVRQRLAVLMKGRRLQLVLSKDGFAAERPIEISESAGQIKLVLENRVGAAHKTTLQVAGAAGAISIDGVPAKQSPGVAGMTNIELDLGAEATYTVTIRFE